MTDQERSSLLSQMAINEGLRNKPIKQMLEEKDREIERLNRVSDAYRSQADTYERTLYEVWKLVGDRTDNVLTSTRECLTAKDKNITEMAGLLNEAMAVFRAYVNVPEANALRDRWEKLKRE